MSMHVSPGVYTKIIDLSEFLQDLPGTNGFVSVLSKKGPDNQLVYIGNGRDLKHKFGDPNISDFGQQYSQGLYVARNHLISATSLYIIRALPWDATYSNIFLALQLVTPPIPSSSTAGDAAPLKPEMVTVSFPSMNSVRELDSRLIEPNISDWVNEADTGGVGYSDGFLAYFRPIGRGDYYDNLGIRILKNVNPYKPGIYSLEIYETQMDGSDVIIETFEVSFDPKLLDSSGESTYIEDVVNKFSIQMRCKVNANALNVLDTVEAEFHKNENSDTYPNNPYLTADVINNYSSNVQNYIDAGGMDLGYKEWMKQELKVQLADAQTALQDALDLLTAARQMPQTTVTEINDRNDAIISATTQVAQARTDLNSLKIQYEDLINFDILTTKDPNTRTATLEAIHLGNGSDGTLFDLDPRSGKKILNEIVATQVLSMAYMGLVENPNTSEVEDKVLDTDDLFLDLVYDAGYPENVKISISFLVDESRRDCMMICDNGDNVNYEQARTAADSPLFNSRYIARYEGYSKVYDVFTGRDLWVSPVYHMAKIITLTDREYELWYAPAGFNRATIDDIKELRWSPKLGERDQLYMVQLNPIVKFNVGYTVWGQLTTQKRPTALQDVNVMRLVLYIKRMLEQFLKFFIFEFNDAETWNSISQGIAPFLESIKRKRGLKNYSIEVGANDYEFKRKICHVNVILEPMKIIERIELNLFIK